MEGPQYIRIILCLAAVIAVLAVVAGVFIVRYSMLRRKNRDSKLSKWISSRIEADNAFIYKVLGKPYIRQDVKEEETVSVLTERLKLLDKILLSAVSGKEDVLSDDVKNELFSYVSDKEKFLHDTYHQYLKLHPDFIGLLKSKGLTEWEAGYCCLYALGLRGKDIGAFLERGGYYNIDSRIRKKLGVTDRITLSTYIRTALEESSHVKNNRRD